MIVGVEYLTWAEQGFLQTETLLNIMVPKRFRSIFSRFSRVKSNSAGTSWGRVVMLLLDCTLHIWVFTHVSCFGSHDMTSDLDSTMFGRTRVNKSEYSPENDP